MKLRAIYDSFIETGLKNEVRTAQEIEEFLRRRQEEWDGLKESLRPFHSDESLSHPFADLKIEYGDAETEVKVLSAGIDIEPGEIHRVSRV